MIKPLNRATNFINKWRFHIANKVITMFNSETGRFWHLNFRFLIYYFIGKFNTIISHFNSNSRTAWYKVSSRNTCCSSYFKTLILLGNGNIVNSEYSKITVNLKKKML